MNPCVFAQTLSFKTYTINEGLSQNSIYSIAQCKDGFMWFGSQAGLNRFDGTNFKLIVPSIKLNAVIKTDFSKMITALYSDKNNLLWVGTTNELLIYESHKDKWHLPEDIYPGFEIIPLAWITSISEDVNGKIWISTLKAGLFCYDKNRKTMVKLPEIIKDQKPNVKHCPYDQNNICTANRNNIYILGENNNLIINVNELIHSKDNIVNAVEVVQGNIWFIVNGNAVYKYNVKQKSILDINKTFKLNNALNDYSILNSGQDGNLWIGSRTSGLVRINTESNHLSLAKAGKEEQSLKKNFILSMYNSADGITWIGTSGGGVSKFEGDRQGIELFKAFDKNNSDKIFDNMILSIYTENETDYYMGTLYGGLLKYSISSRKFQYYTPQRQEQNSAQSNNIYSIVKGDGNLLWLATWGGLYSFDKITHHFEKYSDPNIENTRELSCVYKLKTLNKLIISSSKGIPLIFNLETHKFEKCPDSDFYLKDNILRIRYIEEKENGDLYLATENKSLIKYNYITGKFHEFKQIHGLSGVCRHFMFNKNEIWAGTEDGLALMDATSGKVNKLITELDGLPNNVIYSVLLDNQKNVWVSTNKGIAKINITNSKISKFNTEDGLQDMEFNTAAALKISNGHLVFGGINGFNIIDPAKTKNIPFIPVPVITEIKVMNELYKDSIPYPYLKSILLSYKENFITLGFQCPIFSQTGKINYRYMLSGIDKIWIENGSRNYVNFTQLKPGKYTFNVQAYDGNKIMSKIKKLEITIKGPWFLNFWFLLSLSLSIIGGAIIIISSRIHSIKARKSLLHQKAEAEMQSLRLQMNPHFIFNSLNSINSFIVEHKTNLASDYLTKFSRLMRLILENSRHETITLEKELESVKLYLLMESLRFSNAFEYKLHIDESIYEATIHVPPLIIQPFLENSIWHGLMPKNGTRTLNLDLQLVGHALYIDITDNGIGRVKSESLKSKKTNLRKSHGLEITKNRIHYHNPRNTVQIIDLYNDNGEPLGTKVNIVIILTGESELNQN